MEENRQTFGKVQLNLDMEQEDHSKSQSNCCKKQLTSPLLTILTTLVNSCDPYICFLLKKEEWICVCLGPECTTRAAGPAQLTLGVRPTPPMAQDSISAHARLPQQH